MQYFLKNLARDLLQNEIEGILVKTEIACEECNLKESSMKTNSILVGR